MDAAKQFARSQLGQRRRFAFYYAPIPAPAVGGGEGQIALADFDGTAFGEEYLSFCRGATVVSAAPPCEPQGWGYGSLLDGQSGWFPPSYIGCTA